MLYIKRNFSPAACQCFIFRIERAVVSQKNSSRAEVRQDAVPPIATHPQANTHCPISGRKEYMSTERRWWKRGREGEREAKTGGRNMKNRGCKMMLQHQNTDWFVGLRAKWVEGM